MNKSTTLFSSAGRCRFDAEKMTTLRRQSFYSAGLILFGKSEVCCKDLSVSFRMGMYKKTITIKSILSLQESDHELQKYVSKLGKTKGRILDTTLFFWMSCLSKQCCFLFCRKYYYIRWLTSSFKTIAYNSKLSIKAQIWSNRNYYFSLIRRIIKSKIVHNIRNLFPLQNLGPHEQKTCSSYCVQLPFY